ncbi:hypothetical protein EUX98_g1920 [Antrodiella citrinella]|uniref:Uncharacterized protein n=1 Tax=Antrodiella citrinella TaxID=2447956 RepID=A0A4S4N099_9APHY|nr:hypothetical protein EUX98_g1920 [Antrodiella citrinella]
MIRRDPTLIALSDNDVQDVRELLRRKAYEEALSRATAGNSAVADNTGISPSARVSAVLMKEYGEFAAKRTAMAKLSKEERLGL